LTNDDGITSEGLWAAARGLARVGHVTVVGTVEDWSNGSACVRHMIGARIARYPDIPDGLGPDVEAYSIESSPGAAVLAGLMTGLFGSFDLVASGANLGVNIGGDLIRSGTLGAATIGFDRGHTAFAISTRRAAREGEVQHWDGVADVSEIVARWLLARRGPPILLNVNLPNRPFAEMAGAKVARPVGWSNLDRAELGAQAEPDGSWSVTAWFDLNTPMPSDPDTDSGAVLAGQIAISHVMPTGRACQTLPEDLGELVTLLTPADPPDAVAAPGRARGPE
jgi:5'-nucleotidase